MSVRTDLSGRACSIARGADVLADPWTLLVVRELFLGNRRFDGIVAAVEGPESVVSRRLASLVDAGLADRRPYATPGHRTRHEYRLTPDGRAALPVVHALSRWGAQHGDDRRALRIECLRCGTAASSADWCPVCVAPLTVETTGWRLVRDPDTVRTLDPE